MSLRRGAIRSLAFEQFFLCHCGRCQKGTGSAHGANLFSSTAKVTWRTGVANVKDYVVPYTLHAKSFCSTCGSAVPSVQINGTLLVVPAGSLDNPIDVRPDAHICFASRATWERELEDLPKIDALPT
ncbi:GFA family protein [Litorimonas haliclonae]|uniref:GFA family protein n=1 Tax=Litorimonas haliclonae TaxID=2081977 RepID=UPI0039F049A1